MMHSQEPRGNGHDARRGSDAVTLPDSTEGKDVFFTGGYARHVIPGVGHFPTREAADAVNKLVIDFLRA
jgi:pimeloyl-ACP methyl ester carboxylesterase